MDKNRMTGLFCFDGPLYKDRNGAYCNVTLTNEMFQRYFSVVDYLIILARTYTSNKTYKELNMKPLTIPNIKVVEMENLYTITGFLIKNKRYNKMITQYISQTDLIFARMPSTISNIVLKVACKMHKPYLVEVGGCAWDSFWHHGMMGKMIAPLMFFREKYYVQNADFAVYVTRQFLQNRYPNSNMSEICSNVYLKPVSQTVLNDRLKKIDGMKRNRIVIGQAVNSVDVKYKGEHLIIRAMHTLKSRGIYVEYQIVGPGDGRFLIEQAKKYGVSKQVKLLGTMTSNEVFDWLKSIDLYAQPSKQEGLPRSVIEAMSTACPAIGSNIAGIPELLDADCLFHPDHNDEIVDVILRLQDKSVLKEKASVNFKRASEYNLDEIEARRQKLFCEYRKRTAT